MRNKHKCLLVNLVKQLLKGWVTMKVFVFNKKSLAYGAAVLVLAVALIVAVANLITI